LAVELGDEELAFVWRNARRLGVPAILCEDVVQDVFVVAQHKRDTFEGRSSLTTWLYGILVNVIRSHRRRYQPVADPEVLETRPTLDAAPDELVARQEAAKILERILARMDDDKRAVFVLVDIEQVAVPEAAASLQTNINTAYARLRAARMIFNEEVHRLEKQRVYNETHLSRGTHVARSSG
jgi:RNA polymerase sigma-70 factor (ECF subfamily)